MYQKKTKKNKQKQNKIKTSKYPSSSFRILCKNKNEYGTSRHCAIFYTFFSFQMFFVNVTTKLLIHEITWKQPKCSQWFHMTKWSNPFRNILIHHATMLLTFLLKWLNMQFNDQMNAVNLPLKYILFLKQQIIRNQTKLNTRIKAQTKQTRLIRIIYSAVR